MVVFFRFILVGGLLDPRGSWTLSTLSTRLLRPWEEEEEEEEEDEKEEKADLP